jgi:glycosyltransferase involved in cell wall biosynthesis
VRALDAPRLAFLGHLVDRMGVPIALETVRVLRQRGVAVEADVIGDGPLLEPLRRKAVELGVEDSVTFHGFIEDFSQVRQLLANAALALAPYEIDESSFSRFADPGKIKAYLAAGLPILLTPVPPNAQEIAALGGATIVEPTSEGFAEAAEQLLADRIEWSNRHDAALAYARRFDWNVLLEDALPRLGIDLDKTVST